MNPILEELLDQPFAVCWLGNAGWLIRGQDHLIGIDLDLERATRLHPAPVSSQDLAPVLDALFVTHAHGDHFGEHTARVLAAQSSCAFVLPATCLERAAALGVPDSRIAVARPRQPFDLRAARGGAGAPTIHIEPQRALHGHTSFSVYRHANLDDCGYVITLDGLRFFHPGDSVLLQDHLEDLGQIYVLFVSPTLHNMHVADSRTLVETLRPRFVFPQHFGTYQPTEQNSFWTLGYPDELRAALSPEMQARFHRLEQGRVFRIPD
ncbi:MAG TPA: MBL fold metallo-hydrolase [Chloroflexota bacterium]|nr:MBL fold metallo-hydrolase [Chloroflexota bacterium]